MIERLKFDSPEKLAAALATDVAQRLDSAVRKTGKASLAVSGGSTPKRFFRALSQEQIAWRNVTCTLVDERWVPEHDNRSNAALVKDNLLQDRAAEASFLPLYSGHDDPEKVLSFVSGKLQKLSRPFDVIVLGMGTDGHTASFFPGGDNLRVALDDGADLLTSMRAPGANEPRITLTLPAVLDCRYLVLHIEGAEKEAVLDRAMLPGPIEDMPIRAVLHQDRTDLVIYFTP